MVKNRLTSLLVVALALGLSVTSVMAQGQGGGRGRGGFPGFGGGMGQRDVINTAGNEAVAKELGLSEEVAGKLKKVNEDYRAEIAKNRPDYSGVRDLPEAERAAKMAELQKKSDESAKAARDMFAPKVKEILTADQLKRVQEIVYQANGIASFSDPDVVKALDLTKEQQDKIASINKDAREKSRALFAGAAGGGGGGAANFQANREKMEEIRKEQTTAVNAVLTADQTAKWTALKGKEFDVAKLRPQGGPGGPGGNRGNRGNRGGNGGGNNGRPATE